MHSSRTTSTTSPILFHWARRAHALAILLALSSACSAHPELAFTRQIEARRLAQELLIHFTKASDATNRAVMADTDEASETYAHEARQETRTLETDATALQKLVEEPGYSEEAASLSEFRAAYAKYLELDKTILALAVENTNLKAQRLSFGPVHAAATSFCDALADLSHAVPAKDAWSVRVSALAASLAIRELEVLQAQHIAEPNDATMSELEKQMAKLEADARGALAELGASTASGLQPGIEAANAALLQFMNGHAQLIALSRRNSNVRSQALALGPKPPLTAACERSLQALVKLLGQRTLRATR